MSEMKIIFVNNQQKDYDPNKADGTQEKPFIGIDEAFSKALELDKEPPCSE